MRPRVFPAEDRHSTPSTSGACPSFNEAAGIPRGRRDQPARHLRRRLRASMRPRVFPAEDLRQRPCADYSACPASMRPRVFPAEDSTGLRSIGMPRTGFNEAAGIPRGRRLAGGQLCLARLLASMRPRVFPAEDNDDDGLLAPPSYASMRPRVFPAEDRPCGPRAMIGVIRFNEAAGIPRGRLAIVGRARSR